MPLDTVSARPSDTLANFTEVRPKLLGIRDPPVVPARVTVTEGEFLWSALGSAEKCP